MALSPGIPTSFVPKQPVKSPVRRPMSSGTNLFLAVTLMIAAFSIVLAIGTFAYDRYLIKTLKTKEDLLAKAQANVDENSIEEFVRLRDRLSTGKDLLNNHVVLSQFFDELEKLTLKNVTFDSMKLTVAGDKSAKIDMKGTALNFNALASQSNAFASEKRIKRAIFSGITLNERKQVTFTLTADIDPRLITDSNSALGAQAQPVEQRPAIVPVETPPAVIQTATTTPVRSASTSTPVTQGSTTKTQ